MATPARHDPRSSAHLQPRSTTPLGSNHGSLTQLVTESNEADSPRSPSLAVAEPLVLRLRGAHEPRGALNARPDHVEENGIRSRATAVARRRRRIQWDENVIDNEGLGRKKSKVCCIYHKPRAVGESSDESSSSSSDNDSSSDSDRAGRRAGLSDSDSGERHMDGARPVKGRTARTQKNRRSREHAHDHQHDDTHIHGGHDEKGCNGHSHKARPDSKRNSGSRGRGHSHGLSERRPSPNAYEKMPKYNVQPLLQQPGSES